MMTLDEAVDSVVISAKLTDAAEAVRKMHDQIGQCADLYNEAFQNKTVNSTAESMLAVSCCAHHFGLRVGMAMEKSETGGIKLDESVG